MVVQETHSESKADLLRRGKVAGFNLLGATYSKTHGTATYVRNSLKNAEIISQTNDGNIHVIHTKVNSINIINIYKPPSVQWPQHVIVPPIPNETTVYLGDFNSHHTQWAYESSDSNGEQLADWAEHNNLHLLFDAKDKPTFHSGRWNRGYNPDLCFITRPQGDLPAPACRTVLSNFPHSQHRPVIIEIGMQIPIVKSTPRPRWNFGKANWERFSQELDANIRYIPPMPANYHRFVGLLVAVAKKHIPRGFRKDYIPGWTSESQRLFEDFEQSGDPEVANELLRSLDKTRMDKWNSTVSSLNFTHSSRKTWSLLHKLGSSKHQNPTKPNINPNMIANRIVEVSRAPADKEHAREIKKSLSELKRTLTPAGQQPSKFTLAELDTGIKNMKAGKAAGFDGVYPEFIIHCGTNTRKWLVKFFNHILDTGKIPYEFKQTKIIAIAKPGKDTSLPESYRPIALLSVTYKLLERLLYNRLYPILDPIIPVEQAGFRNGRSCTDQVLSLTTHIEAGYEKKLKTSVAFLDLSAAYDTVWRQGLIYKLLKITKCLKTCNLINNLLSNRMFRVFINDTESSTRKLNNGLPQGSVLAPLLFNLYIEDLPSTKSRKFAYADDLAIASQHKLFAPTEQVLTEDLARLSEYFKKWRLTPNATKTEVCCFHLCSRQAHYRLQVEMNGVILRHNRNPKYLGVTLDRSLTFRQHLGGVAGKLRTRNNIISKLTGTTWGANAATLRTAALALVYSVAEYCAPVWMNSCHTSKLDVQLNHTMRLISGTLKSTPCRWLPVLCNIAPPELRRNCALVREFKKIETNTSLPIHKDVQYLLSSQQRLKSRTPPIRKAAELANEFNLQNQWNNLWAPTIQQDLIKINDPGDGFNGNELPRQLWTKLNRVRTGHGRTKSSMYHWGRSDTTNCDCGAPEQTMRHIITECPGRHYTGDLEDLALCTPTAIQWLQDLDLPI